MEDLKRLQQISLCMKVTQELESHLGIKDKVLAEFIIELVKKSNDQKSFEQELDLCEAELPADLITKLFSLIKKMLPKQKLFLQDQIPENKDLNNSTDPLKPNAVVLQQKFPGLAISNKKQAPKEELDIDLLDLLSDDNDSKQDKQEQQVPETIKHEKLKQVKDLKKEKDKKNNSRSSSNSSEEELKKKKKKKKTSRSRSDSKNNKKKDHQKQPKQKSRSKSRLRSRSRSGNKNRNTQKQQQQQKHIEVEIGKVYDGIVTNVLDFGCFVALQNFKDRKEGLVHISEISDKRISNAFEIVKKNQRVKVKVMYNVGTKIKLSMKEVDQETGEIIEKKRQDMQKMMEDQQKPVKKGQELFGSLTGIKLEAIETKKQAIRKKQDENEMWELSRLKYNSHLQIANEKEFAVEEDSDCDEVAIEVSDKEPLFLKGQTTKTGIVLSPIKCIKNPEGTLNREAINALQYAKERKEMRDQQQRAVMDSLNKAEFNKNWDDPNADPGTRTLVDQLRQYGLQQGGEQEQFNKEALFRNSKHVNKSLLTMKEQKESLPIYEFKDKLIRAIQMNRVLIVIGETGSGKTTQMTQYLLEAGYAKKGKKICCTQPRRVAAMSVAKRVAEEMGVVLGEEVGYSIRFEDCTSQSTIIKYCTDGMLLREALLDPDVNQYSVVMLDEAHERNVNTDVLFGLLKKVVQRRNDFTLIVTSATLDAEKFSSYFHNCNIFRIPGRTFPVEILYSTEPETDYLDAALIVVMQIHLHEPAGDILLFLTGQEEIDNSCQTLYERMKKLGPDAPELIILPVYSSLPSELQQRIFLPTPKGARKVVIATNIAEASITIDGIYYVVDPGFCKLKMFNPQLGHDVLRIVPVSQASAKQRAGRAGRTGPGKCYRLFTEEAYKNEMLPLSVPEIQRTNLTNTVLTLKAMGINDLLNFDFMDPPPVQTLINSLEQLYSLQALDDEGLLTRVGMKMAEFPLMPTESKMLLTSIDLGCADEIITIIAMLQIHTVFFRPKDKATIADQKRAKFFQPEGDFLTLLTVYEAWKSNNFSNIWCHENYIDGKNMRRAQDVRKQIVQIMDRYKLKVQSCGREYAKIRKAIGAGFFFNAAKKDQQDGYKTTVDNHTVYIHPSSALFNRQPEWLVYSDLVLTSKEYMRNVCTIEPKWLLDVAPNFFQMGNAQIISQKKKAERLEPMSCKFGQDPNAWRQSKRRTTTTDVSTVFK